MSNETIGLIIIGLAILFIVIGLVKKLLWMCVIAVVLGLAFGVTQPDALSDVFSSAIELAEDIFTPLEGETYEEFDNVADPK